MYPTNDIFSKIENSNNMNYKFLFKTSPYEYECKIGKISIYFYLMFLLGKTLNRQLNFITIKAIPSSKNKEISEKNKSLNENQKDFINSVFIGTFICEDFQESAPSEYENLKESNLYPVYKDIKDCIEGGYKTRLVKNKSNLLFTFFAENCPINLILNIKNAKNNDNLSKNGKEISKQTTLPIYDDNIFNENPSNYISKIDNINLNKEIKNNVYNKENYSSKKITNIFEIQYKGENANIKNNEKKNINYNLGNKSRFNKTYQYNSDYIQNKIDSSSRNYNKNIKNVENGTKRRGNNINKSTLNKMFEINKKTNNNLNIDNKFNNLGESKEKNSHTIKLNESEEYQQKNDEKKILKNNNDKEKTKKKDIKGGNKSYFF